MQLLKFKNKNRKSELQKYEEDFIKKLESIPITLDTGPPPNASFELLDLDTQTIQGDDQMLFASVANGNLLYRTNVSNLSSIIDLTVQEYSPSSPHIVGNVVRLLGAENFICIEDTDGLAADFNAENTKWEPVRDNLNTQIISCGIRKIYDISEITVIVASTVGKITTTDNSNVQIGDIFAIRGTLNFNATLGTSTVVVIGTSQGAPADPTPTVFYYANLPTQSQIPASGTESIGEIDNLTRFNVSNTTGFIVDNANPEKPLVTVIDKDPVNGLQSDFTAQSQILFVKKDSTFEFISGGDRVAQDGFDKLRIGFIQNALATPLGNITTFVQGSPDVAYQRSSTNAILDRYFGGVMTKNGTISKGTVNVPLGRFFPINLDEGEFFYPSTNYQNDVGNPNFVSFDAITPVLAPNFLLAFITGSESDNTNATATTGLDPDKYNPSNSLVSMPIDHFQIFRVYGNNLILISYYGDQSFESLQAARNAIDSGDFFERSITIPFAFRGYVILQQGITSWNSPAVDGVNYLFVPKPPEPSYDRGNPQNRSALITQDQINSAEALVSTGVIDGGEITLNTSTSIDIATGQGVIANHTNMPFTITGVSWSAETIDLTTFPGADLSKGIIYITKNISGTTIVISTDDAALTSLQDRTLIKLAVIRTTFGVPAVNEIRGISNLRTPLVAPVLTTKDFTDSIFLVKSGSNVFESNPSVNLQIGNNAGEIAAFGLNSTITQNNPNVLTLSAVDPISFRLISTLGETTGTLISTPNVANFDDGGVITAISPSSPYSVQRLWCDPANALYFLQYGTVEYSSADIETRLYEIENPVAPALLSEYAFVLASLILERTSTTWNSDTLNEIIFGDITGGTATISGTGGSAGILSINGLTNATQLIVGGTNITEVLSGGDTTTLNLDANITVTQITLDNAMAGASPVLTAEQSATLQQLNIMGDLDMNSNNILDVNMITTPTSTTTFSNALNLGSVGRIAWTKIGGGNIALLVDGNNNTQLTDGTDKFVFSILNGALNVTNANNTFILQSDGTIIINIDSTLPFSSSGVYRLPNNRYVRWRDAGNTANLGIKLNASDTLEFDASINVKGEDILNVGTHTYSQKTLVTDTFVDLDFLDDEYNLLPITANVILTTSNRAAGRRKTLLVTNGSGLTRLVNIPTQWFRESSSNIYSLSDGDALRFQIECTSGAETDILVTVDMLTFGGA